MVSFWEMGATAPPTEDSDWGGGIYFNGLMHLNVASSEGEHSLLCSLFPGKEGLGGAHPQSHPLWSGIDRNQEAPWRCPAGVVRGADVAGSPGPRFLRGCSCESGRLTRPLLARPVSSEGEFLCSTPTPTPRKPASPLAAGAPLFSPPPPPSLPRSHRVRPSLLRPGRADPAGALPGPSTWPPGPSLQAAERALRARASAAGVRLQAQRGTRGFGEAAARGSGSLRPAPAERTKSKTSSPQRPPRTSAVRPSEGPGWPRRGWLRGSWAEGPE